MRVLVTLPWGENLGGAESMLAQILDGGATDEIELVFFQDGPWPAELAAADYRVEVIPSGRVREVHKAARAVAALAALLRRRRPDVLLNWMPKTQLYGAPAATLARTATRVVWWQHGITTGHWTDRAATALPAFAVGCSSQAAARAQEQLRPRRSTFVVAPGTPAPSVSERPAPLADANGVPVVGILGRLQPWKGQDRLLRAQALLRDRGVRFHLLIVGGDAYGLSPEYARSLPQIVHELGLGDAVTMTGHVDDAGPWIRRMDVLANASEAEPFGIVLLEAMARGVPVVAVGAGGPTEIVQDGVTGVLARSGEPAALADALQPLLASAQVREEMGRHGLERHDALYTDEAMRARFWAAMRRVAEGS